MERLDEMVLRTQQYLNATYISNPNWVRLSEDGQTGWGTIRGLIRALQIETGISTPNGTFGPATEAACPTLSKNFNPDEKTKRLVYILQGAMWCKGFSPGGFTGTFGDGTEAGVKRFQTSAGLDGSKVNGVANPMIFKALLNMDAYVLVSSGDPKIREIQMCLNRDYHNWIGLRPTDGRYGRDTNKALIYAIQVEEGIDEPNGVFGPTTQSLLPTLAPGSKNAPFVKIMQYALYCNRFDPTGFTGVFGNGTLAALKKFQAFCMLVADGYCGKSTWASLMVSCGDKDRKGTACDCSSEVTSARAKTLKANGYEIVGRYIAGGEWKKLKIHEAKVIFENGLRLFPIFQKSGNSVDYFTQSQGYIDGQEAVLAAMEYGFPEGTTIYFAVDFDAVNDQVTSHILPYFRKVKQGLNSYNPRNYKIGVYGARNVCSRVGNEGISTTSFVCDMSTGFSGNLGYPLPEDWAFDQIKEFTIGSGDGAIAIDNNICSNRDRGVDHFIEKGERPYFYEQVNILQNVADEFAKTNGGNANSYVAQYLRRNNYYGLLWDTVAGPINEEYVKKAEELLGFKDIYPQMDTIDTDIELDVPHFAATYNSLIHLQVQAAHDSAGWGGDLVTLIGDTLELCRDNSSISIYEAASSLMGTSKSTFSYPDLLADIDALNIGKKLYGTNMKLGDEMISYYINKGNKTRFTDFIENRFGTNSEITDKASNFVNVAWLQDPISKAAIEALKKKFNVPDYSFEEGYEVCRAFADFLINKSNKE
ncbi:MAG: glycoside hydrolase domain-containing protein [Peptostreptococcaceae bacterium]